MSSRSNRRPAAIVVLLALSITVSTSCSPPSNGASGQKPIIPASVSSPLSDSTAGTIVLTAAAEKRLGIRTVAAAVRPVVRSRLLGGIAELPPGRRSVLSAQWTGDIATGGDAILKPGARVVEGQAICELLPTLSPERVVLMGAETLKFSEATNALVRLRLDADAAVKRAEIAVTAATTLLERAKALVADRAGAQKAVDEAQSQLDLSRVELSSAIERRSTLGAMKIEGDIGKVAPMTIRSPRNGIVESVRVSEGQTVVAGAEIATIISTSELWLRVSVPVGVEPMLDGKANARYAKDGRDVSIAPIDAPPTADSRAGAVDRYFELKNEDGAIRPGQRILVRLSLRTSGDALTVPRAALVFDIHGSAAVFVKKADLTYAWRRVEVSEIVDDDAVVTRGLGSDEWVVVDGAAELFGAGYGFGK